MPKIPVYTAIQIQREAISEQSGHTKPWVVTAATPDGLIPYVVKLYNYKQVDDFHCVTNEIIGNMLAQEFGLKVPQCALIEIPQKLVINLPTDMQKQFENSDHRLKFATLQLKGVNNAIPRLDKLQLTKRINIDTLYAFDNLICNRDRGFQKSNLLLGDENAFLIDHELCFNEEYMYADIENQDIEQVFTKYHLCYSYLKRTIKNQTFFNEFAFYLRELRPSVLNPYFQELKHEGFNDYSVPIIYRLEEIKRKSTIFVTQLKSSLQ